jgi:hypothetical protein
MTLTLNHQPPELLLAFHARLSRRYGAPEVRLLNFPGRCMVFRTADLAASVECAVIDVAPSRPHTADDLVELESTAEFAVGQGHDATLVVMDLAGKVLPRHDPHAVPATPVLTITVWSLAHHLGVTGTIELDSVGTPIWIGKPYVVARTGSSSANRLDRAWMLATAGITRAWAAAADCRTVVRFDGGPEAVCSSPNSRTER